MLSQNLCLTRFLNVIGKNEMSQVTHESEKTMPLLIGNHLRI